MFIFNFYYFIAIAFGIGVLSAVAVYLTYRNKKTKGVWAMVWLTACLVPVAILLSSWFIPRQFVITDDGIRNESFIDADFFHKMGKLFLVNGTDRPLYVVPFKYSVRPRWDGEQDYTLFLDHHNRIPVTDSMHIAPGESRLYKGILSDIIMFNKTPSPMKEAKVKSSERKTYHLEYVYWYVYDNPEAIPKQ